ncbi:MAG: SdrD B-like domain-containing protein [Anaerolineae bacterium]
MYKRSLVLLFVTAAFLAFTGPQPQKVYMPFVYWHVSPKGACQGQILCTVYEDSNGNGRRDDNEVGIPRIRLALRHLDGSGEVSKITDPRGQALFAVRAGRYSVHVEEPSGYELTTPHAYGVDIVCATIPLDFGLVQAPLPASEAQPP